MDPADIALPSLAVGAALAMVVGWNGVFQGNTPTLMRGLGVVSNDENKKIFCGQNRRISPDIHYV